MKGTELFKQTIETYLREFAERDEQFAVDIRRFVIVQSRGKCNQDTKRHNEIINLVKKHMNEIRRIAA